MSTSAPVFYLFAISHYCEKARWALDYLGIEHELRFVGPGEHGQIARQLGAPKTSVPYLDLGGEVIQGSADIINWAESTPASNGQSLTPDIDVEVAVQIEQRADDVVGVHIRRMYYSEAMVEHPSIVRRIFLSDLSFGKKPKIGLAWSKIRKIMISRMDLGLEQGIESHAIVDAELTWLDERMSDGREFLVGERLSRADIAMASLFSPLVLPIQHPTYASLAHPPRMAATVADWSRRPSMRWIRDMYAKHR